MKIVLINPPASYPGKIAQKCYPPLNLLYLAAVLEKNGFTCEVLDANAKRMSVEEIADYTALSGADLAGLPVFSLISKNCNLILKKIKAKIPGIITVAGGPEASALPEKMLNDYSALDYVISGEGEIPLLQLCLQFIPPHLTSPIKGEEFRHLSPCGRGQGEGESRSTNLLYGNLDICPLTGHLLNSSCPIYWADSKGSAQIERSNYTAVVRPNLQSIKGLHYRENGRIINNGPAEIISNPDLIPFPLREKVNECYSEELYYTILLREKPVDTIVTSRGCPFSCRFCYNSVHRYRMRSVENVIEEILEIKKRGIKDIEIVDDSFTIDRNRALRIFDHIIKEGLNTISYRIKSRVDAVDEELLKKAKQAGVYQIAYGCESFSEGILKRMNKKITREQISNAIQLSKKTGIFCHTSWIIGFPGETPESISETVGFIKKAKPHTVNIAALIPYPQTEVYLEAKANGTLVGDWSCETDYVPWVKLPWIKDISELKKIMNKALLDIYIRPWYFYSFGKNILGNMNTLLLEYAFQELKSRLR